MTGLPRKLRVVAVAAALSAAVPAGAASFSVLYDFNGVDAFQPQSPLLVDTDGALLGTSPFGGSASKGSVFRLPPGGLAGSLQVLYAFTGGSDGSQPFGSLAADSAGNFYGVATGGGDSGDGTLFEIARNGTSFDFERLYSFSGGADGGVPVGGLAIDDAGNLYGTTARGGAGGVGTVFEWKAAEAALTTLYAFSAPSSGFNADGALPEAPLLRDASGDLFGTTAAGGPAGAGVVFSLVPEGPGYVFSVLHAFSGGEDQTTPVAGLASDPSGNLFGTTSGDIGINLYGTVFELQRNGRSYVYRTIHTFEDVDDGATPYSTLVVDGAGNLFGTAAGGGPGNSGTLFELVPSGSGYALRVLHAFLGALDGSIPAGGVVADRGGKLYGTTLSGAIFGFGTIYSFVPPPIAETQVVRSAPGESVSIALSASDAGLAGATFTFAIASAPTRGALSPVANGMTTYTPADSNPGVDAFTFTATDANGTSTPATVTVTQFGPRGTVAPASPPAPARIAMGQS